MNKQDIDPTIEMMRQNIEAMKGLDELLLLDGEKTLIKSMNIEDSNTTKQEEGE